MVFAVRATMGFQFQSVPAIAPLLARDFGVGLADIGLLIGLYLAPGVVVALPAVPSAASSATSLWSWLLSS